MELYHVHFYPQPGVEVIVNLSPIKQLKPIMIDHRGLRMGGNRKVLLDCGRRLVCGLKTYHEFGGSGIILRMSWASHLAILAAVWGQNSSMRIGYTEVFFRQAIGFASPERDAKFNSGVLRLVAVTPPPDEYHLRYF